MTSPAAAAHTSEGHLGPWPEDGLERVTHCPACGSDKRTCLHEALTDRIFFCAPGKWTLHECQACHSAYLDPRPSPQTIHLAYQTYYTHSAAKRQSTENLSLIRRLVRSAANGYRNRYYRSHLKPSSPMGGFMISLLPSYRRVLDQELRYLPPVWPGARLLDVGFGSGTFLERASSLGWSVVGVDPDPTTVANARQRGLEVYQGLIETLGDRHEQFDVITFSHVIEHVHNPGEALTLAGKLLKPGGQLFIETPNITALSHQEFGRHWRGLEPPRHLTLFTWSALERLLKQAGFAEVKRILQPAVYPNLAAKSRALSEGKDPYQFGKVTPADRKKGKQAADKSAKNHHHSEYITLLAFKSR